MNRFALLLLCISIICINIMCAAQMLIKPNLEYGYESEVSIQSYQNKIEDIFIDNKFALVTGKSAIPENCDTLFSFIHVSDIQLRDSNIVYFGKKRSKYLDRIKIPFVHGEPFGAMERGKLDTRDEEPYIALIGAINQAKHRPSFVLHTGDAIDAGTMGEMISFIALSNFLEIPWFNVIGNHDIFIMGNLTQDRLRIINPRGPGVLVVQSRDLFIKFHGWNDINMHFPIELRRHIPTQGFSYRHGFDRTNRDTKLNSNNQTGTPHYSILLYPSNPKIRLLGIDTNLSDDMILKGVIDGRLRIGYEGLLRKDEFEWLDKELKEARLNKEFVIMAGHHPLSNEKGKKILKVAIAGISKSFLLDYLKDQPHVLAYFGGHTHKPYINVHGTFAEVIAPSLHEFPQTALLVTLLKHEKSFALSICPVRGEANTEGVFEGQLQESFAFAQKDKKKEGAPHWNDNDQNVHRFIQLKEGW